MVSLSVPLKNQLLSNNPGKLENCVPTSIASGLQYLTKRYHDGGMIKNDIYGEAWDGPTDPDKYSNYCKQHGVRLRKVPATLNKRLLLYTLQSIQRGYPVLLTEKDPYDTNPGDTHVVLACGAENGILSVMDPFIGKYLARAYSHWLSVMRGGAVYGMELIVPEGWKDDGKTLVAPNSVAVVGGFREWVLTHAWRSDDLPASAEGPRNPLEISNDKLGAGTQQLFNYSVLGWTKSKGVFQEYVGPEIMALRKKAGI